jgi:D-glycero-D-manno-heptose 1,7-bisphosphate phosphatase
MKTAVFIERDGLLNTVRIDRQQPVTPLTLEEFKINEEAVPLMQKLRASGFLVIVTTNQPGLTRGYQSRRELDRMHDVLRRRVPLDEIMVCPHDETDRCPCRKPKAGLLVEASFKFQIDLDHSYVISDKWQDAEAGRAVGCTSVLIQSPWIGKGRYDMLMPNLTAAVEKICHLQNGSRVYAAAG